MLKDSSQRKFISRVLPVLLIAAICGVLLMHWSLRAAPGSDIAAGTYTGDGSDDRVITGVGFQPNVVLLMTEGTTVAVVRTSTMAGDASKPAGDTGALQANLVQSLDGDGFTVGSDSRVNTSSVKYHWVAMKTGGNVAVGSYVGNGVNNRSISGVGFQPSFVVTLGDAADSMYRPGTLSGTSSFRLAGLTPVSNRIQALEADGFRVSANADVNGAARTYHYIAFQSGVDVSQSTYGGDGVDNRSISGLGLQPAFVLVKRETGTQAALRPGSVVGDRSLVFDGTTVGANRIQALEADGFQVGTNAAANAAGSTYHYLALGGSVFLPTPTPPPTPTDTPTPAPPVAQLVKTGLYTGDGTDDRAITGVGFQPNVILLMTEGTTVAVLRTSTMAGDASKPAGDTGALQANLVQSLDADGFTVGSDTRVNTSGAAYHWVAMKVGTNLAVGSYVGNGVNNRSILGVGFFPSFVMTLGNGSDSMFRPGTLSDTGSFRLTGFTPVLDRIEALEEDGFKLSNSTDVNQSGVTYHYIALRNGAGVFQGGYAGDGLDNRSISGLSFQPVFVLVKREDGVQAALRPSSISTDLSLVVDGTPPGANRIQALQAAGFQVGTNSAVNASGSIIHYLALGSGVPPVGTPTPTPTPDVIPTIPASVVVPHFVNATSAAGIGGWSSAQPYSFGVDWNDYNNDFWPDVFYGRHAGLKSSLYRNNADGTFTDIAPTAGIQKKLDRHGCTWADYDRDGYIDLSCTGGFPGPATIVLYHNNGGNGTFTDVAAAAGLNKTAIPDTLAGRAMTWGDFDGDGWLDIFHNGEFKSNVLAHNNGNSTFTNVAVQPLKNYANSMQESDSSVDYDNDNKWDVFDCSVRMPRHTSQQVYLFRNNGNSTWQRKDVAAGIVMDSCHSGAWGDYTNDGLMDLFIGGRTTPYPGIEPYMPPNPGAKLYRNLGPDAQGNVHFQDVTAAAGILATSAHQGVWGDYNNDGLLDLYVVNAVGINDPVAPKHRLYINNGDGTFTEVAAVAGADDNGGGSGDGASWADYNRDGSLDLLVANGGGIIICDSTPSCPGPPRLFLNTPNGNHWLEIHLRANGNPFGYGSKVWLTQGGVTQLRQVTDGVSGMSQNYQMAHFGLASATSATQLKIRWPDGTQTILDNVAADQELLITEGGSVQVLTP